MGVRPSMRVGLMVMTFFALVAMIISPFMQVHHTGYASSQHIPDNRNKTISTYTGQPGHNDRTNLSPASNQDSQTSSGSRITEGGAHLDQTSSGNRTTEGGAQLEQQAAPDVKINVTAAESAFPNPRNKGPSCHGTEGIDKVCKVL